VTVGYEIANATPIVGAEAAFLIFGGYQLGPNALLRFYVLHVVALPLATGFLIAIHFWRIRKDGGISGPL
jgi:quinol-cytochrome oxidoreductase complex cytochrome b subunit